MSATYRRNPYYKASTLEMANQITKLLPSINTRTRRIEVISSAAYEVIEVWDISQILYVLSNTAPVLALFLPSNACLKKSVNM